MAKVYILVRKDKPVAAFSHVNHAKAALQASDTILIFDIDKDVPRKWYVSLRVVNGDASWNVYLWGELMPSESGHEFTDGSYTTWWIVNAIDENQAVSLAKHEFFSGIMNLPVQKG